MAGLRVVDCTDESGDFCGKLLADLGADVIKVEPPGGSASRRFPPFASDTGESLFFRFYNQGKRSVTIDSLSSRGRRQLAASLAGADLLLATPKGSRSPIAEIAACHRHPGLVVTRITPFGVTGPLADAPACDLTLQAAGGMIHPNGFAAHAPLQGIGLQAQHLASVQAAIGALLALLARDSSSDAMAVDVSTQACVAICAAHATAHREELGRIRERSGALHWSRDFDISECRDGYLLQSTAGDWSSLRHWLAGDGRSLDGIDDRTPDRRRHSAERIFATLAEWSRERSARALADHAQSLRLPFAVVRSPSELVEDPQLRERGFFDSLRSRSCDPPPPSPRISSIEESTAAVSRPAILTGLRVLDFTRHIAGPVATRVLADHGAEVIKVEPTEASYRDALFSTLNRGKRSIAVDLTRSEGLELIRRMIPRCDAVVDNFSPRVMANFGFAPAVLRQLNPRLITLSMSAFGASGPWRDHVAYGPTLHALAGFTALMSSPDLGPAGWGFSFSDFAAGFGGALALLAALWQRRRTGTGMQIDFSQYENLLSFMGPALLEVLHNRSEPAPPGNRSQEQPCAPHGVYRCRDQGGRQRWCALAARNQDEWLRLRSVLGAEWAATAAFASPAARLRHQALLDAELGRWARHQRAASLAGRLQNAGVPAAVVADADDLRRDPQLRFRRFWTTIAAADGSPLRVDGSPWLLEGMPVTQLAPAPGLGAHTDLVLGEILGHSPAEIRRWRANGVVA